jgi:hypothetical protein
MATASMTRIQENTPGAIKRRIEAESEESVRRHAATEADIEARLGSLAREWDVERALETGASTFVLTGTLLAATVDRRWLAVPAVVSAFLLQHALQGWCPPLPVFRSLGFRTRDEIARERYALKALRGDFILVPQSNSPGAVRRAFDAAG